MPYLPANRLYEYVTVFEATLVPPSILGMYESHSYWHYCQVPVGEANLLQHCMKLTVAGRYRQGINQPTGSTNIVYHIRGPHRLQTLFFRGCTILLPLPAFLQCAGPMGKYNRHLECTM
jgi:hypothetical protein